MRDYIRGSVRERFTAKYVVHLETNCWEWICVNPQHLEPVTHQENDRRGYWGSFHVSPSACPHGHPYDERNTCWRGRTPVCKTCMADQQRRRRARKRGVA